MSDDPAPTGPDPDLCARVEGHLTPGERIGYATWVGHAGGRRPNTPDGSLAAALEAVLPEPDTLAALVLTDVRLLVLREVAPAADAPPQPYGLRGLMDDIRKELTARFGNQPPAPRPIAELEPVWQAPRESLANARAEWGSFADRVVLCFADASSVALTAPHAKRLAAALTTPSRP